MSDNSLQTVIVGVFVCGKPKRLNWRKTLKESVNMCVYRRAEANFDDLNPTRLMESSNSLEDRFPLINFCSMEFGDGEDFVLSHVSHSFRKVVSL